ncbi:MAG TPA: hypothetical protein VJT31_22595 [Rugosimonospora sp.]|nr:hypothetical protein [Rugosimonospora sp.]
MTPGRSPDPESAAAPTWLRPAVLVPVTIALSLVGGRFRSFSPAATWYVLGLSAVLAGLGLSGRVPKRPVPARLPRAAAWWLVPVLLAGLLELVDFLLGSVPAHPSLSRLLDPVLAGYLPRCAGYAAWLAVFWWLVRR